MVQPSNGIADKTLKAFRRRKILTIVDVAELIHSTIHTARRRLKEWKAYNSYNKNGRYYTLPDVPTFDAAGLWRWRGVFFSRYGNLTQTLIELVRRSRAGLAAAEMRELLGLDPRSFLSAFADHPQLRREKTQGRFVYYSADPAIYSKQQQQRSMMSKTARPPSDLEAIAILVERIKHPQLSIESLCGELAKKKHHVGPETVCNLFTYHGLAGEKTPHSPL